MEFELGWKEAGTIEYLEIDLDNLEEFKECSETWEWWRDDEKFVSWNVSREHEKEGDGLHIIVRYEDNQTDDEITSLLDSEEDPLAYLGTNRIIIEGDRRRKDGGIRKTGKFHWTANNGEKWTGRWKTNDIPRDRTVSEQAKRDGKFRGKILGLDGECVITGEKTDKALEAAHIVPVKEGGKDSLDNGIILRADIHRLYDARLFRIDPKSGKPTRLCESLSPRYKRLFENDESKLPRKTLNRVKRALEKAWKDSDPDQ